MSRFCALALACAGGLALTTTPAFAKDPRQTADMLKERPDPPEILAAALKEQAAGKRILLARADRGRDLLRQELQAVATVEQIAVYTQKDAVEMDLDVINHLRRGEIDFITLTSANIARSLLRHWSRSRAQNWSSCMSRITVSPASSAGFTSRSMAASASGCAMRCRFIRTVSKPAARSTWKWRGAKRVPPRQSGSSSRMFMPRCIAAAWSSAEIGVNPAACD